MTSIFDFGATGLFIAAVGLFLYRLKHEDPRLAPYLAIIGTCALGNWAGNSGAALAGIALLSAAGFLLVHLASEPFREEEPAE
jgi:hypothetical protein